MTGKKHHWAREEVEPTVRAQDGPGGDTETILEHPAFGMISINRVSGLTHLFGSDFQHHNWIEVRIYTADLRRNLSRDWPFARKELICIQMSEAQFATWITTPNVGHGVQCTIDHINHVRQPGFPLRAEAKEYGKEGYAGADLALRNLDYVLRDLQDPALKITNKDRERLVGKVSRARSALTSLLPFVLKSFLEHLEHRAEKAKSETFAWIQHTVARAGITALTGRDTLQLPITEAESGVDHQEGGSPEAGAGNSGESAGALPAPGASSAGAGSGGASEDAGSD